MKPFLSVIVLAQNEGKDLPLTLVEIDRRLKAADYSHEVVVVDDKSSSAADTIGKFEKMVPFLRSVPMPAGGEKEHPAGVGMLAAKGTYRLFADAAGAAALDQFSDMIPFFKEGYDVVIGSRAAAEEPENFIVRSLLLPGMRDALSGFACFSERAAEKVFPSVSREGKGCRFEALVIARAAGLRLKEVPVRWDHENEARTGLSGRAETLRNAAAVKLNVLLRRYPW